MARQTDIRIRRSAVSGAIPLPANLNLGELALNTADGKAYMKKSIGGVDTVIEIGSSDPGSIYSSFEMFEYTAQVANQTTFSGADQNSNTLDYNTGSGTNLPQVQVYLNGILLDYGTDFTATNGSSVVFSVAVSAGDLIQIAAYKSNVTVTADLDLADNQKILLGDDDDLEIYHDGLKSIINDTGTGNLQFQIGGTEIFESTSDGIVLADGLDVEATEFIGDLRGSVLFKAQAGEALSKGDVVTITGISGNTTVVSKADADDASLMPAFGVAAETVSINAPVDIYSFGIMSNLTTNINGWTEGSPLYVSTIPGEMTDVPPSGSTSLIQQIAKITKIHPSTGSIDITGAGRANATPNLDEGKIFVGNSSNRSVQVDDTIHVDMANSRVGINTSTPQSKLDVKLSNNTTANIGGTISVGTFAGLSFGYSEVGNSLYRHSAIVFERDDAAFGDARGNIHILNSPSGSASADLGDSRLTIVPNGNVGIGTTNPIMKLQVVGNIYCNAGTMYLDSGRRLTWGNSTQWIEGTNDTSVEIGVGSQTRATFLANGNVGIGTSSPVSPLQIQNSNPQVTMTQTAGGVNRFLAFDVGLSADVDTQFITVDQADGLAFGEKLTASDRVIENEWMRITNAGNVGIGTTTPGAALEVLGNIILRQSASNSETVYITTNARGGGTADADLRLGNSVNGDILTIHNANVGIGTTSPAALLHVSSGNSGDAVVIIESDADNNDENDNPQLIFKQDGGVTIAKAGLTGDAGTIFTGSLGNAAYFGNDEAAAVQLYTNATARLTIESGGNVGIGTTTPDEFGVGGSFRILSVGGDNPGILNLVDDGTNGSYLQFGNAAGLRRASIHAQNGSDLAFTLNSSNTGTSLTERLRIKASTGNVGIGTSSPNAKLELNVASGDGLLIKSADVSTIKMKGSGGVTDWGFAATYQVAGDFGIYASNSAGGDPITAGTAKMYFTNAGNVGIGTTSPGANLHIGGQEAAAPTAGTVDRLHIQPYSNTGGPYKFKARTVSGSSDFLDMYYGSTHIISYGLNGNVGIGTTSPTHKLQVSGSTYITNGFGDPNVEAAYRLKFYDNGGTYNDAGIGLDGSGGGGENMWFNALNGFYWNFGTNGKKMVLLTNGNLGIGVTVPKAKLQVEEYGIDTTTSSTAAITQVAIHTFPIADFRSAKCTIQVTNTTDSTYHITEMLMIHNGTTVSITEYGTVYTGSAAEATFDADISSTNLRLLATPATTDGMTFKVVCHSITV